MWCKNIFRLNLHIVFFTSSRTVSVENCLKIVKFSIFVLPTQPWIFLKAFRVKDSVHPKMEILIIYSHSYPSQRDFLSSVEDKRWYFEECLSVFVHSIKVGSIFFFFWLIKYWQNRRKEVIQVCTTTQGWVNYNFYFWLKYPFNVTRCLFQMTIRNMYTSRNGQPTRFQWLTLLFCEQYASAYKRPRWRVQHMSLHDDCTASTAVSLWSVLSYSRTVAAGMRAQHCMS